MLSSVNSFVPGLPAIGSAEGYQHTCDRGSIAVDGLMGGDVGGDRTLFMLLLLVAIARGVGLAEEVPFGIPVQITVST